MFKMSGILHPSNEETHEQETVALDGSNLARLINMRAERARDCSCDRCNNLISRIHMNGAFVAREHNNEQWGLKFWKKLPNEVVNPSHSPSFDPSGLLHEDHDRAVDSLIAAEHEWQQAQSSSCAHEDSDNYWLREYAEAKRYCEQVRARLEAEKDAEQFYAEENQTLEEPA